PPASAVLTTGEVALLLWLCARQRRLAGSLGLSAVEGTVRASLSTRAGEVVPREAASAALLWYYLHSDEHRKEVEAPATTRLTGSKFKDLAAAVVDAFPDYAALARAVRYGLDESLQAIAGEGTLQDVVFNLVRWAHSQGRLSDLLDALVRENPGNARLST